MTTIVTRSGKAAPLTNTELDTNFTNLNTDKLEKGSNLSDLQSVSQARTNLGLGDLATQNKASLAGPVVLTDSSTSPALKITQTGTGNALVVEDAASDTTPFVIDQNGNVAIRSSTGLTGASLTVGGDTQATIDVFRPTADTGGPGLRFVKNRNTNIYAHTIVNNGDTLGAVQFFGSDGAANIPGASVAAQVDGTPGPNDMPGRLVFSTTPDNSATPTERMRIDSAGNTTLSTRLKINGLAGSTPAGAQAELIHNAGASVDYGVYLRHYNGTAYDAEVLIGGDASNGGSTLRFQTGGSERMRIRSDGNVGIGYAGTATYTVAVSKNVEGGTTAGEFRAQGTIQSSVTNLAVGYSHQPVTAATAFTCANIQNFRADGVSLGAGSSVSNQTGFIAESGMVNATNNYGFYGNIPAGTGRYNFYAAGTADNYFAGNVGIGATTDPGVVLTVRGAQRNHRHSANDAAPIYHANVKARGTSGTPLTVNNGDGLAAYQAYAYDGSGERPAATIAMQVDGVPATSTVPGRIIFSTAPAGTSQVPLERMRIDSSGNVGVGVSAPAYGLDVERDGRARVAASGSGFGQFVFGKSSTATNNWHAGSEGDGTFRFYNGNTGSGTERLRIDSSGNVLVKSAAGLGYGTGAGGTVTQVTSKSTGVTLNTPSGQITMHNAALAAGAEVFFTVNNSLVTANDLVVLNANWNPSAAYFARVYYTTGGAFNVSVKNMTAGSLSDAVVLNFCVIKGAIA